MNTIITLNKLKKNKVEVNITQNDKKEKLTADIVLSAVGVTGNITGFGLEELGVEIEKNHIKVNKENYNLGF